MTTMEWKGKNVLVTGGAGFIGSHIVDHLIASGARVTVFDNFSTGHREYLEHVKNQITLVEDDLIDLDAVKTAMQGMDFVFHMAANADIRKGIGDTRRDLEQNTIATWNVCEAMRLADVKAISFFSSSAVYGEPEVFPTPEEYPLVQTSLYGASKMAAEGLIQAFANYFDWKTWIFRSVSIMGPRYSHGVVYDFIQKLRENPKELEILGNGEQKKSFMYVADCVAGIFKSVENAPDRVNITNLGTNEFVVVKDLAQWVLEEANLETAKFKFTGGDRGWIGDQPVVHLKNDRLKSYGWEQSMKTEDTVRKTAQWLLKSDWVFTRA